MNKPNYNEIIKTARKVKGLTQQELANQAGISLRTVQRIERGTEEISGFSLRQICKVLDIPLENMVMQNIDQISIEPNQIGSIRNLYLSSLSFILFPLLGFIVPAIIGLTKENKKVHYKNHLRYILLLQGIQSITILFLLPLILSLLLLQGTSTPQQIDLTIPDNKFMSTLNTPDLKLERQDSIYIIKNFNAIHSLQRTKVLEQNLMGTSKDSVTFHNKEYNTIAATIGLDKYDNLKENEITKLNTKNQTDKSKETNWLNIIVISLVSLYYLTNIGFVIYQINHLNQKT